MTKNLNRCCDLVMKGGITSGVLYPAAIQEIARKFHLVGIGGTSAGAIAATVTAAAEYRRRKTGSFEGFEMLDEVATELSTPGRLLTLFQPDRDTQDHFELFMKFAEDRAGFLTKLNLGRKLLFKNSRNRLLRPIVDNGFGVCTGMGNGHDSPQTALTEWLADLIDRIADKQDGPLTFRDLHEAPIPSNIRSVVEGSSDRSIDLRAVTTCTTFGRPFEIPFNQHIFAFDPTEWRRLFPKSVVDDLVRKGDAIESTINKRDGKLPLSTYDLPVVVAARMSLSFPVLFTMVPLWSANVREKDNPLQRVWFSDGGVTSNFPIHRFDSLYPSWPTLGVNLQYTDETNEPQRSSLKRSGKMIYMIKRRSDGTRDLWNQLESSDDPVKNLLGFGKSIFSAAQTWHDNAFLRLPGYRDRLVEVWLKPNEGGLNLNMSSDLIKTLADRGREAGKEISERFADSPSDQSMSWTGHRWTRYRSGMAGLVEALTRFGRAANSNLPGEIPLEQLLAGKGAPPCYPFDSNSQLQAAKEVTDAILELARKLEAESNGNLSGPFTKGPRPTVEIGSRAPI